MLCKHCGFEGNPNLEETGPHTKTICKKCGKYIKMIGQKELDEIISARLQLSNEQVKEELVHIRNQIDNLLNQL